jgi:hypothetical protein
MEAALRVTGEFCEFDYQPYIQISNSARDKVGEAFGKPPTPQTLPQEGVVNEPSLSPIAESSGAKTIPDSLNEHGA